MNNTKKIANKINHSDSYEENQTDIMMLMEQLGISESYMETASRQENMTCTYETGMWISKAFDIINIIPKMKWLPKEIKQLYKKSDI